MENNGGLITEEDLANYKAIERKPITGSYRDFDIISMPPPSSGGVALVEMLNILEDYDLSAMGHNTADYLHLLTETMRRAYACLLYTSPSPRDGLLSRMPSSA